MKPYIDEKPSAAEAMAQATAWLDSKRVRYRQRTPHHIKIGPVNFWPGTSVIAIDGEEGRRPVHGLAGLQTTLVEQGLLDASKQQSPEAVVVRIPRNGVTGRS